MLALSYDLHIHSCLSPCGDNESTPANIVGMAYIKGLDVIALCDHNTAKNCPAAAEVAKAYGVTLICGMEITTEEEVHVVCLMPSLEAALELDEYVNARLSPVENRPEIFGDQLIMDCDDNIIGRESKLLINAVSISFEEVFPLARSFGGVAFPAHVDKAANSLISNLGFVPPNSTFKTAEVKYPQRLEELTRAHPYFSSCKIITNSDAHYLQDINEAKNFLHAEEKTAAAVIDALKNPQGTGNQNAFDNNYKSQYK